MELSYRTPNTLSLELNLDELSSLEEIYEEMLLERSSSDPVSGALPERVHYDKIPKVFTSLDAWPRRTNLKCWACDFNFETRPLFVPLDIKDASGHGGGSNMVEIPVHGNMCSFPCAALYITANYSRDQQWKLFEYLFFLFKIFRGRYVTKIDVAPRKTLMQQYGGNLEPHEFRKKIERLETDILRRAVDYEDPPDRAYQDAQQMAPPSLEALLSSVDYDSDSDSELPSAAPPAPASPPSSRLRECARERADRLAETRRRMVLSGELLDDA